ncbi:hypothetical protein MSG28_015051 [Choristoneura fumiferana]|uniref:Uncharacterized protein n=1 Tax=Choristoneura fumiferana TaxID=7141 RepID=A0ACC0KZB6_CHOFU|nr:hypothetical protein MSG28_015051 [Choristoneura fumiferana]
MANEQAMAIRIYLRILGYVVTLAIHISNIVYMRSFHQGDVMKDPKIRAYIGIQWRFITCWNFLFQMVYACLGLTCDVLTLVNSKNKRYELPKLFSQGRKTLFSAIVWPSTFVVATLFWPFYLYDKSLVFPDFIDKILTPLSNHVIHSFIVPVVLWEIMLQPLTEPRNHMKNALILFIYTVVYFIVLFYTAVEQRLWIYPIFEKADGTIYTPMLMVYSCVLTNIHYRTQWYVASYLWGQPITKERIVNTKKRT